MKFAHKFALALSPAILLLTTTLLTWSQDSWTPDHDGNGFNNSFERAVDLGELKPAGINVHEQLGAVPWGFDTRDMYRFVFPGGVTDFQLSVKLDEEPDATMWINICDRNQQLIYTSIGAGNEQFSIPLTSGLYFMEVLTSREVANGRNLRYTLGARPVEVPLPEQGGTACRGAPNLGSLAESREISGNLNETRKFSVYSFYVPFGASLSGNMLGLQPSRRYIVTAIDRLNGNSIRVRDANLQMEGILIDPGFYCLRVESVGTEGYGNYRGNFIAQRAGLFPGNDKSRAQNIIDMELGNLSQNGAYGFVSRYLHYQKPGIPNVPTVISHYHEYVIRDWVGFNARSQYYWFNLPSGENRVELRLFNQMAFARAFIEDESGKILAASVVDRTSLNPDFMPSQSLTATLRSGQRYYLRIDYASSSSPGTSFGINLRALPSG